MTSTELKEEMPVLLRAHDGSLIWPESKHREGSFLSAMLS